MCRFSKLTQVKNPVILYFFKLIFSFTTLKNMYTELTRNNKCRLLINQHFKCRQIELSSNDLVSKF